MAFVRRLAILRMLPRRPRRIATSEVHGRLVDQGFEVDVRTVQRDLEMLSGLHMLPIVCDDRARNNLAWYWNSDEVFDLASMDPPTALTFALMDDHLASLLPPLVRKHLAPHVRHARGLLDASPDNHLRDWSSRIRVLPRGVRQISPETDASIADVVYEALLTGHQFEGVYRARYGDANTDTRRFHPLGLLLRDRIAYLVAVVAPHTEPVYLALHRFQSASLTKDAAIAPRDFDLDAYIREKSLDFRLGEDIRLEFLMDAQPSHHIEESPLGRNQVVGEHADGRRHFTVTVEDTQQLRWWILGYGDQIEVIGPPSLREELKAILANAAGRYT